MIAIPKSRKTKKTAKNPTETISVSQPIPIPVPVVAPTESKPPSYRQRLIQRIGLDTVREKEKLSRLATKERKERKAQAQAVPVC